MQNDLRNRMAQIPHHRDEDPDEHPATDAVETDATPAAADPDATTRKQGRPKKGKSRGKTKAARPTLPPDNRVPSLACPGCGMAIWPRQLRGASKSGEIPCECTCCGHRFGYIPAKVRSL